MDKLSNIDIRDAFFDEIYNIAAKDKNVIFITADADAFSLRKYKKDFPEQFINVGVAEQNMIAVAVGLALSGKKVFIYALIPFIALRCYEHIKTNICGMNLPITIIGAGAGFSFENDGPTHHAVQDIAVMRTLPEMVILNPSDSKSATAFARLVYQSSVPTYIRLDKGTKPAIYNNENDFSLGLSIIKSGSDICIISTGIMTFMAQEVANELAKRNIKAGAVDFYRLKPVNERLLLEFLDKYRAVVTLEENAIIGGIGSIVSEVLIDNQRTIPLLRIASKDEQCFCYGTRDWIHGINDIDIENVLKRISLWYNKL